MALKYDYDMIKQTYPIEVYAISNIDLKVVNEMQNQL